MHKLLFSGLVLLFILFSACKKSDTEAPVISLNADTTLHYLNMPYVDPGFSVTDNKSNDLEKNVVVNNPVDINNYGTYTITYSVEDENGNTGTATRDVDIILNKENYYHLTYSALDSCGSGSFFYTGLIQDCNCPQNAVTVANISNFGLSAIFTLPLSGQYNEIILMDTAKAAVTFIGNAIMSNNADTLFWNYNITDSVKTEVCSSVWIKQ